MCLFSRVSVEFVVRRDEAVSEEERQRRKGKEGRISLVQLSLNFAFAFVSLSVRLLAKWWR